MNAPQQLFDRSAEEAVLGSLLLDPECIPSIAAQLHAEDFYLRQNALVYVAICALATAGAGVDVLTVAERLEAQGDLAKVGGAARNVRAESAGETYGGVPVMRPVQIQEED